MSQMTKKEYLATIQNSIEKELMENIKALPEGFNRQRFILNCISVLKDNLKDFNNVDMTSIATGFTKGAFLGLDFFNKECYLIPYGGAVNFQTDYKGEIKLTKRYATNPIKDIYAKNVRKGDLFEESITDGVQSVSFKPVPFSSEEIIGTFAVVLFKDGSMMYETMSREEIEGIRNSFSKAANSKAWKATPGEMYKKTVLRRLCKLIDLDFDNIEQQKAFDEGGDFEADKVVVDAAYKEVETTDPFEAEKGQGASEEVPEDVDFDEV